MTKEKLKIGVMLNSFDVPAWNHALLKSIQESDFCELSLFIVNREVPKKRSFIQKLKVTVPWLFFAAYSKWDKRRFMSKPDAFESRPLLPDFDDVPTLDVVPIRKRFVHRFEDADVKQVRSYDLDVILRFGFNIIRGDILHSCRYGVWSFHHDDNQEYRGGPALFWEIYEGNPVSGTILQILTESLDGGKVIYRSHSRTHPYSLFANRNANYWKTSQFVLRRLNDLYERGFQYITSLETYNEVLDYTKGIYTVPKPHQLLIYLIKIGFRMVKNRLRYKLFMEQWFLEFTHRSSGKKVTLKPPRDRFYADPFMVSDDGKEYCFIEDYDHHQQKGLVSVFSIEDDGVMSPVEVILDEPFHMSYPFVFQHDGQYYMIPETAQNNQIRLYKATEFPKKWELDRVLMEDIQAVDVTLHHQDGFWWLFCNTAAYGASRHDECHLYMSKSLEGPWDLHPSSPIVSDVRMARPAGRLFEKDGKLIRPTQDCSKTYGYAVHFKHITLLNSLEYHEELDSSLFPNSVRGAIGVHSFAQSDTWTCIDAKRWIRKS